MMTTKKSGADAPGREMTGAEMVIEALADQGVQHLFGYPGGAVLPIYDAIFQQQQVQHILVRHEQGAVHAAEGYARSTGKVGCVLVTSGPGATNAVTGLTDAPMDSIPIVCLTGRPGPVVVDIPKDIQFAKGLYTGLTNSQHKSYRPQIDGDERAVAAAVDLIANAKRPV